MKINLVDKSKMQKANTSYYFVIKFALGLCRYFYISIFTNDVHMQSFI